MALDLINDELIAGATSAGGSVRVYSRTADGAAAPLRTITTTVSNDMEGVAVDPYSNELFAADWNGNILVFSRTADGETTPLRTITGLSTPAGITLGP